MRKTLCTNVIRHVRTTINRNLPAAVRARFLGYRREKLRAMATPSPVRISIVKRTVKTNQPVIFTG